MKAGNSKSQGNLIAFSIGLALIVILVIIYLT
ncbi:hypothetical protein BC643_1815 [Mangrovibacterium diazotrophicum]|uniref:Uncharacterized protein n=1 Tax=Mangrovibacterium diazotrophicum TaxID=1261403 RepID=A0A419W7Q8_9BACT|nr:hypothetical protein BC643_1815 [Mangrovibacterium diazotrophicum]